MTDLDLDETYQAQVYAAKRAWQEALEAVNAQRNTMEGAKVGSLRFGSCVAYILVR